MFLKRCLIGYEVPNQQPASNSTLKIGMASCNKWTRMMSIVEDLCSSLKA